MAINFHAKVNKKVWEFQNFAPNDRFQCKDGTYILWQADLVNIGSKLGMTIGTDYTKFLSDVCEQVGGVLLTLAEAKEEQDNPKRTLPKALDERFVVETPTSSVSEPDEDSPADGGSAAEDESDGDASEAADSEQKEESPETKEDEV
jgi:hypothetical protein